jgi:hypothetical protein
MKCYRVWFTDGTACLVDARNSNEARQLALERAKTEHFWGYDRLKIASCECLSE